MMQQSAVHADANVKLLPLQRLRMMRYHYNLLDGFQGLLLHIVTFVSGHCAKAAFVILAPDVCCQCGLE